MKLLMLGIEIAQSTVATFSERVAAMGIPPSERADVIGGIDRRG